MAWKLIIKVQQLITKYLNEVEQRAFGDNNHDFCFWSSLADFIQAERRVELAGEGFVSLI
jgi:hypothetical protein